MEFNINTQLRLKKSFMKDKRVEKLKTFNNWTRIVMIYMMLVGFAERSKTGNVVVYGEGDPVPISRISDLINYNPEFLEYSLYALEKVNLIETIGVEGYDAIVVATNGLFYA